MSALTKFLRQTCTLMSAQLDNNGAPILDKYGEPVFATPVVVKCRCEHTTKDVLTPTGSVLKSASRYFVDNSATVRLGDKVDGKAVIQVSDFIGATGMSEGWMFYV